MGVAWRGEGLAWGWMCGAASWASALQERALTEGAWAELRASWADPARALPAWCAALGWERLGDVGAEAAPGEVWMVRGGARLRVRLWAEPEGLDAPQSYGRGAWLRGEGWAERILAAHPEEPAVLLLDPARACLVARDALGLPCALRVERAGGDLAAAQALWVLASAAHLAQLPAWMEDARRWRVAAVEHLSARARSALVAFLQALLDHPHNAPLRDLLRAEPARLAALWGEARALLARLLFLVGLEHVEPRPALVQTPWWSREGSPRALASSALASSALASSALAGSALAGSALADSAQPEGLEAALRGTFALFAEGGQRDGARALGGGAALFGSAALPLLDAASWGEEAVAGLLSGLFRDGDDGLPDPWEGLPHEALVAVAEGLVGVELGLASEPLARLRRGGVECVSPVPPQGLEAEPVERIEAGRLFARAGHGRKEAGAYYTPKALVRFLVREALSPLVERASPPDDPHPARILALSVVDPAVGGGAFLAESCRFLGEAAWRACLSLEAEAQRADARALDTLDPEESLAMLDRAERLRARLAALKLGAAPTSRAAQALCRWAAAARCLYGVDREPLAVALAQAALWLEAWSDERPLPDLAGRVVLGDALTAPSVAQWLACAPATLDPLPEDLRAQLQRHLQASARDAGLVGRALAADLHAPAPLDPAPWLGWRALARAWAGATMLGAAALGEGWGEAWVAALASVKRGAAGLALDEHPPLRAACAAGAQSLPWELVFPQVFFAEGAVARPQGFDAVLSNPPWEVLQPKAREALAAFDLAILDAPTKRERASVEARLMGAAAPSERVAQRQEDIARQRRALDALYRFQKVEAEGALVGAQPDLFRAFLERGAQLLAPRGWIGAVVPATFHAGEGATGVRRLFLEGMRLRCCLSFENRRRLFGGIDPRVKFDLVVARKEGRTWEFEAGFGWTDPARLFDPQREALRYSIDLARRLGGAHLSLPELRDELELDAARACAQHGLTFGEVAESWGVRLGRELDMTHDADRFTPSAGLWPHDPRAPQGCADSVQRGWMPLYEGKTFHQYTERWGDPPRYAVATAKCLDKPDLLAAAQHPRLILRAIASASNERTVIAALASPGACVGNSALCERAPHRRPLRAALVALAVLNSFVFDWLVRRRSAVNVNLFLLRACPFPSLSAEHEEALADGALRLSCADGEPCAPLWRAAAQPSDPPPPALDEHARAELRARLDALVARAYGLTRPQLAHLLGSFSHKRDPDASARVLAAWDALAGVEPPRAEPITRRIDPTAPHLDPTAPHPPQAPEPRLEAASPALGGVSSGSSSPPLGAEVLDGGAEARAVHSEVLGLRAGGLAQSAEGLSQGAEPPMPGAELPISGAEASMQGAEPVLEARRGRRRGTDGPAPQLSLFGWLPPAPPLEQEAPPVGHEAPAPPVGHEAPSVKEAPAPPAPEEAPSKGEPADEAKRRGRKPKPRTAQEEAAFEKVWALLRAKGELTSQDAQRETGLEADEVRPHLQRLLDEGRATTSGQRRGLRYHLV